MQDRVSLRLRQQPQLGSGHPKWERIKNVPRNQQWRNRPDETSVTPTTKRRSDAPAIGGLQKRALDLVLAVSALVMLAPLFLLISVVIKISDGGPILFRHRRVGRNGTYFDCLKFRTMVTDAEAILHDHLARDAAAAREWTQTQKLKDDPRITWLGRGLRNSSLDELPQLLNVVKGEMSLVGPRPIVAAETSKYGTSIQQYFRCRPGITGAWQVNGRNETTYQHRVALDHDYVENWKFRRDLVIIGQTVRVVLTARGCY